MSVPNEQPEVLAEESAQPAAEERPSWLPSNFTKPEDLAKSYEHSRAKLTQTEQELATLKQQVEGIVAQQEQARYQNEYATLEEQLAEQIESGDPRQILAVQAYIAQSAVDEAFRRNQAQQAPPRQDDPEVLAFHVEQAMLKQFPDWEDIRQDVGRVIEEYPSLAPRDTSISGIAASLKAAGEIAKARRFQSSSNEIRGVADEALSAAKNAAQTITGASQRPATMTPAEEAWESIKNAGGDGIRLGRI